MGMFHKVLCQRSVFQRQHPLAPEFLGYLLQTSGVSTSCSWRQWRFLAIFKSIILSHSSETAFVPTASDRSRRSWIIEMLILLYNLLFFFGHGSQRVFHSFNFHPVKIKREQSSFFRLRLHFFLVKSKPRVQLDFKHFNPFCWVFI